MSALDDFTSALAELKNYAYKEAELEAVFDGKNYPCSILFMPDSQTGLFEENCNEDGEVGGLRVTAQTCTTVVENSMAFTIEDRTLKKLVRLAAQCCNLFYHAYRERNGAL